MVLRSHLPLDFRQTRGVAVRLFNYVTAVAELERLSRVVGGCGVFITAHGCAGSAKNFFTLFGHRRIQNKYLAFDLQRELSKKFL